MIGLETKENGCEFESIFSFLTKARRGIKVGVYDQTKKV